jgi:hypothetical protein
MAAKDGRMAGVGTGHNPASRKTQFSKGNKRAVKPFVIDPDDMDWALLLDFEWVLDHPHGEAPTGLRKHFQKWLLSDPVEFTKQYTAVVRRLKAPNRAEQRAAEERAADESEERVEETVGKIVCELRARLATVATGGGG